MTDIIDVVVVIIVIVIVIVVVIVVVIVLYGIRFVIVLLSLDPIFEVLPSLSSQR